MFTHTPYQFFKLCLTDRIEAFQLLLEIIIMKVRPDMTTLFQHVGELHMT